MRPQPLSERHTFHAFHGDPEQPVVLLNAERINVGGIGVTESRQLDLRGVYLEKAELDDLVSALELGSFPDEGLTLGIVVDEIGRPVEGAVVSASMGTVSYLLEQPDLPDMFVTGATSATGIFMSRDAPFGTQFSTGPLASRRSRASADRSMAGSPS
jgi:hypothetical protein